MSRTKHYEFKVYFTTARSIKRDGFLFDIGVSVFSVSLCVIMERYYVCHCSLNE